MNKKISVYYWCHLEKNIYRFYMYHWTSVLRYSTLETVSFSSVKLTIKKIYLTLTQCWATVSLTVQRWLIAVQSCWINVGPLCTENVGSKLFANDVSTLLFVGPTIAPCLMSMIHSNQTTTIWEKIQPKRMH